MRHIFVRPKNDSSHGHTDAAQVPLMGHNNSASKETAYATFHVRDSPSYLPHGVDVHDHNTFGKTMLAFRRSAACAVNDRSTGSEWPSIAFLLNSFFQLDLPSQMNLLRIKHSARLHQLMFIYPGEAWKSLCRGISS